MRTIQALEEKHLSLIQRKSEVHVDAQFLDEVEVFLQECISAGADISQPEERNQLRAYIRTWGNFLQEHSRGLKDGTVLEPHRAPVLFREGLPISEAAPSAVLRPVSYDDEATYRAQLAAMYRRLEFTGIPELEERRPITIEDIFIRLRAEREAEVAGIPEEVLAQWMGEEPEELTELRRTRGLRPIMGRERVSVEEALQETNRLVVLGDPGAGKTTLLKYLTVICAEGRAQKELRLTVGGDDGSPLPVFVPLREFAAEAPGREDDYSLLDYLYTHASEHLLLSLSLGFFEEALENGRCLVCLDGLDEVWAVGQRKSVRDAVKALTARYPRSRYVVTSRIVGYDEAPMDRYDFTHHTILPFEDEDIRDFVCKWYEAREHDPVQRKRQSDDLISAIEREPHIRSLAQNPLLLTIVALVHRIEAELPHERVKLYDKCVTALVETWEEAKGLSLEKRQRPSYRYRRRLLERLAYELHAGAAPPGSPRVRADGGQLQTVKEGDLELLLSRFLMENRRLRLAEDPDGARDEARAFIHLARGRTGQRVERGEGVFGFPHLTFQEYLAACDIENRLIYRGVDAIWEEIEPRLHDPHWREVILLLLGSLNKYDEPPTLLVGRILEAGEGDKFEPVLHRHLYLAAGALADRVDVADELRQRVVTALLEIARVAPIWEQTDAFRALSWLKQDSYAAQGLLALAHDPGVDNWVCSNAVWTLERLGYAEEAAGILLALARDEEVDVRMRYDAAEALGKLGRAEEAAEILLGLAREEGVDAFVRRDVASSLGKLGRAREAVEILLGLARDEKLDTLVRRATTSVLGQLGRTEEEALNGLLVLARDEKLGAFVRCDAAETLGKWGRAQEATEILLALARGEEMDVRMRYDAAEALGELGRAQEAAGILLALARDEGMDVRMRYDAAEALGELGHAEEATDVFMALTHNEKVEAGVRRDIAEALGKLNHLKEAAEVLLALVHDEEVDTEVRRAAASSLGRLGYTQEAAEVLLDLAQDERVDAFARRDAAESLGELDRIEEAAEVLLGLAGGAEVDALRCDAAKALGDLGRGEEAAEVLLGLACDEEVDGFVRCDAAKALGDLGRGEEASDVLLALTCDGKVEARVRRDAAGALGQLGYAEEAAEILLGLACDEKASIRVRRDAARALGQLDRTGEKVLNGLLSLARDEKMETQVRSAAYESLERLVGGATGQIELDWAD